MDGTNNPCIQSVFFESFPIYTAHFSQNGHEVIVGSRHSAFYCYDMIAGKLINVPRIKGELVHLISVKYFYVLSVVIGTEFNEILYT